MTIKSKILMSQDGKDKMIEGIRELSNIVCVSPGPRGQNVALGECDPSARIYDRIVVHDGVTISRSVDLEDEFENMGAQLVKQAAQKQVQDVGDGTTVVILLAMAIIEEANKMIVAGINPMSLRKGIEDAVDQLIKEIEKLSIPVTTLEQKKHIATVSAEDPEIGELVANTIDQMGAEGLVAVEESRDSLTSVEKQEGMQLEKGFLHQLFITNPERQESILENPRILITDRPINSLEPLVTVLKSLSSNGDKLVIIAPSFGAEATAALLNNKMSGILTSLAIIAPSFGVNQKNTLQDMALFTGARYITEDAGHILEEVTVEDLGSAEHVSATKLSSIIVGGHGDRKVIKKRIAEIKHLIKVETEEFDREKMKERLAKLTTGVSIIKVGGATEVEMKERLERVKDAVEATKAAVTSGIVPGGEVIYLRVREKLDKKSAVYHLMYDALYKPFQKLLDNAGLDDGEMYAKLGYSAIDPNKAGVDVTDGQVKDMIKSGIVDPAMVSVQALLNASSVAIQVLTTGAVLIPYETRLPKLQDK